MKRPVSAPGKIKPIYRFGIGILGLAILLGGFLNIATGNLHYLSYRGGLAFSPFSILLGGLLILMAIRFRS